MPRLRNRQLVSILETFYSSEGTEMASSTATSGLQEKEKKKFHDDGKIKFLYICCCSPPLKSRRRCGGCRHRQLRKTLWQATALSVNRSSSSSWNDRSSSFVEPTQTTTTTKKAKTKHQNETPKRNKQTNKQKTNETRDSCCRGGTGS